MATTTFECNKDTRIAQRQSDNESFGAGASDYLPVGLYSGYKYRSLLGFSYSFAGMVSITNAVLHIKTSTQFYVAFGSDPDVEVRRLTESWSEGNNVSLSTTAATEWDNQPSATSTNMATFDVSTAEKTWDTVNITGIMQDALSLGVFHGLKLQAVDEGAASDVTEFYAREYGSNDAYIEVTYTTNVAASAPTITAPTASEIVASTTPTLTLTHNDSDGDAAGFVDIDIDTTTGAGVEPDWLSLAWQTVDNTSDLTNPINIVVGTTLTRGQWYAMRSRTASATGVTTKGPWSATRFFKIGSLPTATVTTPGASHTAKLYYSAGSNTTPKFEVTWSFTCPDGHAQTGADVKVYDEAGSSLLHTHAHSGAGLTAQLSGYTPANGTKYQISVTPTCTLLAGTESTKNLCRARWGRASYYVNLGLTPTGWQTPTITKNEPGSSLIVMEYAVTADASAEPTTWSASLAGLTLDDHLWHRATFLAWGSGSPTSPSLQQVDLPFSAAQIVPDFWTLFASGSIDESTFVFGTQCLKLTGDGTTTWAYQVVEGLIPGLSYILSGRVKSLGNSGARLRVYDSTGTTELALSPGVTATQEFGELDANGNDKSKLATGSFVATATSATIRCSINGSAGTFAWFDALKLEQSSVVTPWTPGFVGKGVTIDAGGVQVDGTGGGTFRLRTSDGSIFSMNAHSLTGGINATIRKTKLRLFR